MDLLETGGEYRHPWELSRYDCLLKTILTCPRRLDTVADIGCGDLFFTKKLASSYNGRIFAVDKGFKEKPPVDTGNKNIIIKSDIKELEDNSIDIAILMDVLEHIENQNEFLTTLSKKLSEEAIIYITIPAFEHLFSGHDVFLKHQRRYSKKLLSAVLADNGFKIKRLFYFYSILYIPRLFQLISTRLKKNMVGNITSWKKDEQSGLTRFIRSVLNLDFRINKKLGKLSMFGLSLFAICKKVQ